MTRKRTFATTEHAASSRSRRCIRTIGILGFLASLASCLDRPIGETHPETQNIFVKRNQSTKIDKIDVIFMIDNSASMADKQQVLAAAVPQLLTRLTTPDCIDPKNPLNAPEIVGDPTSPCKTPGYIREFSPVNDIHIGVVTSSLGDVGGTLCDPTDKLALVPKPKPELDDRGWLLGSLARTSGTLPSSYLTWSQSDASNYATQIDERKTEFRNFVTAAGETGCGYEMSLESWYRFLIDPEPPASTEMVSPAGGSPYTARSGKDTSILEQRRQFLRPDSLLAIVMLTDENDCSISDTGRAWLMTDGDKLRKLKRGSTICATKPDDPCCYSCNDAAPPTGCAADPVCNPKSTICATNPNDPCCYSCDDAKPPTSCVADPTCAARRTIDTNPGLRCFDQKKRLGYDFLFPTNRYVNALKLKSICPYQNYGDLDCECKGHEGKPCIPGPSFPNPIYAATAEQQAAGTQPRSDANMVFLTGILGVPWQDIATTESLQAAGSAQNAQPVLKYLSSSAINWSLLLPDEKGNPALDPLMRESTSPRSGIHPITNEPIGLPTGTQAKVNNINFHEWNSNGNDLQFACVFDLNQQLSGASPGTGSQSAIKDCSCAVDDAACATANQACSCAPNWAPTGSQSPLCQNPVDGSYGQIQYAAKAYPGTRQLEVLKGHNDSAKDNSIVASICPKDLAWANRDAPGYGYNPAVAALVDRLKSKLVDSCLPRQLATESGKLSCEVVEAVTDPAWTQCVAKGRNDVAPSLKEAVRRQLKDEGICDGDGKLPCSSYSFCSLKQLTDDMDPIRPKTQCETLANFETVSPVPGFCYVDPDQGIGSDDLVANCPTSQKRKLRIVGDGGDKRAPAPGWTFIACSGKTQLETQK